MTCRTPSLGIGNQVPPRIESSAVDAADRGTDRVRRQEVTEQDAERRERDQPARIKAVIRTHSPAGRVTPSVVPASRAPASEMAAIA